jgi:hypothetical protein
MHMIRGGEPLVIAEQLGMLAALFGVHRVRPGLLQGVVLQRVRAGAFKGVSSYPFGEGAAVGWTFLL